jgi:uncharacterized protein YijF (DUF1287 family)
MSGAWSDSTDRAAPGLAGPASISYRSTANFSGCRDNGVKKGRKKKAGSRKRCAAALVKAPLSGRRSIAANAAPVCARVATAAWPGSGDLPILIVPFLVLAGALLAQHATDRLLSRWVAAMLTPAAPQTLLAEPDLPRLALAGHAPVVTPIPGTIALAPLALAPAAPEVGTVSRGTLVLARIELPHRSPAVSASVDDVCRPSETTFGAFGARKMSHLDADREHGDAFAGRLAAAAAAQAQSFVIYNPRYTTIAYPMGDVSPLYGVCTDVIIRAYRAVGIDLQELVHQARVGTGDTSIDHRRTETLRRFLAQAGDSLPVTADPDDYAPGDIVTYWRPQNRGSKSHIAVVTDRIAPSGRPMIVHNRGWGPQLEDALFIDEITGHYRYRGPATATVAAR